MDELKSAWEIAQERVNRLGELSAEEREQQERQGSRQIGHALAQIWLDSSRKLDIAAELIKHQGKARVTIKRAAIERLVEPIELSTTRINSVKKVIEAISSLEHELQPKTEEIDQLIQEYVGMEQKTRQELESNCEETLHQLRISGTAVGAINIETDHKWQLARQRLIEDFTPRLNALKQALIDQR